MRPENDEYPGYYEPFIGLVKTHQIVEELEHSGEEILSFIRSIEEGKGGHRYDDNKWSIKEVLMHIIDTERIYAYRALRFARNDASELPGFDENHFANHSKAEQRSMESIATEFEAVRRSSIELIRHMDQETLLKKGKANNNILSVRAIAHIIAGHALHHCNIIKERYS